MTLLEVLAGLAILGSVLAMLLTARARYLRQYASAKTKLAAVEAADELVAQWWRSGDEIRVAATGPIADHADWLWQTTVVNDRPEGLEGQRIVRVSVRRRSTDTLPALAIVDVVVPRERLEKR